MEELFLRGYSPESISGHPISKENLRQIVLFSAITHDIGKKGETNYKGHVQKSINWAQQKLKQFQIPEPYSTLILKAIEKHHLRDNPETILEKLICLADSYASSGDRPELQRVENIEKWEPYIRKTLELEEELFGQEKPILLLIGDVDSIKSFVYETNNLPEIRGGSAILKEIEEQIKATFQKQLALESLIYCGGGGFIAIIPKSSLSFWKENIEKLYLSHFISITLVHSHPLSYTHFARGIPPYDDKQIQKLKGTKISKELIFSHFDSLFIQRSYRKNFGELIVSLTSLLRQKKLQKTFTPFFPSLPITQPCESCGKRPAEKEDSLRKEYLCTICYQKRQKGRKEKKGYFQLFQQWLEENRQEKIKFKIPETLNELAGQEGRIAILYGDGNNMGDYLQMLSSPASYRHFSKTLDTAVQQSLFEALDGYISGASTTLPFEILVAGGDDLLVILPASHGWAIAIKTLENFHRNVQPLEKKLQQRYQKRLHLPIRLTMSIGLVFADVKYPIRFLLHLSEGLLKKAKELSRKRKGENTICHLWLRTSVILQDAPKVLQTLYQVSHRRITQNLTARPYTLEQAKKLTHIAKELKILSSSARHQLATALEKGVYFSLNFALYQTAKHPSKEKLISLWKKLGKLLGQEDNSFFFWKKEKEEWKTALLDALELIDLGILERIPNKGSLT